MGTVYLVSDMGKLTREDEHLCFHQIDNTCYNILVFQTDMLVLIGNISFTGDALRLICKNKIPVIFVSKSGFFNSRLDYSNEKNVFLHQEQFHLYESENSLAISKTIVQGKIKNQLSFIQRIKRKKDSEEELESIISTLKKVLKDVEKCNSKDSLRGYEGLSAKNYFQALSFNIEPEWAIFKTRSQHPPKTNVNAVLSFLYTMLSNKVRCAIELQGLDVSIGNLHELSYGKDVLVYDLMEEFRVPVCDTVCCSLFNLGILKEDDFEKVEFDNDYDELPLQDNENKNTGIYLTKEGMKKVISAFEDKLQTEIIYEPKQEKLSYEQIIYEQSKLYKQYITDKTNYTPFILK